MLARTFAAALSILIAGFTPVPAESADAYCNRFETKRELGVLVPAYFYPDEKNRRHWMRLVRDAKSATAAGVRFAVIVNPSDGDFPDEDPNYTRMIRTLDKSGAFIIGYIYTRYGERSLSEVESNINAYRAFHPQIDGFFVDEANITEGFYEYYASIRKMAIRAFGGSVQMFGNPGVYPIDARYDEFFDVTVVFEERLRNFDQAEPPATVSRAGPSRNAYIIYDALDSSRMNLKRRACDIVESLRFRDPPEKNGGWWFMTSERSEDVPYTTLSPAYTHVFRATCSAVTGDLCR